MFLQAALEQGMEYPINYRAVQNALAQEIERQLETWQEQVEAEAVEDQETNQRRRTYNDQFPGGNYRQRYDTE